jgi:hypothetical protein
VPVVPVFVGQKITSTLENNNLDWVAQTVYQSVDLTRNNTTTFLDSFDLVVPVLASASYTFESNLMYDTAAAADVVMRISYPLSTTGLISNGGSGTGITTATNAINQQATSLSSTQITLTYGGVGTGTVLSVCPSGGFTVFTTGGFLTIGFAQSTANASNSLLKKWSWIRLSRVA